MKCIFTPALGTFITLTMLTYFSEKPGKCPYVDETKSCDADDIFPDECDLDSDRANPCPGDMICCENPCGRKCVSPIPGKHCSINLITSFS